ncbi:Polyubiquitin 8 [Acorus gramineus]|uniref:Polyubiquitin 8 n=1 Tax=Acorus gramineus TaxID=55184 RepID=A0AAV9AGA0_ACOGR|nr:Polyubiquitin 8 [Acorus gramineus]
MSVNAFLIEEEVTRTERERPLLDRVILDYLDQGSMGNSVVEITKGSSKVKCELDKKAGMIKMDIFLRVIRTIPLRVKSSDKISDVKAKLHETVGVRASLQKLFYGDNHLMDDKTLADFGIARNSTLNMYISSESEEQIFIKTSKGNTITLEAKSWETIHTIKTKISEKEGVPLGQQALFYAGRSLEDIHSLNFYGIKKHSTLHLVLYNDGLQISVATPHGETITLNVKTSYTVYDVKMLIESKTGLQQSLQRLTYNDRTLQDSMLRHLDQCFDKDDHTLNDYSIEIGSRMIQLEQSSSPMKPILQK